MKLKLTLPLGLLFMSNLLQAGAVVANCEGQDSDGSNYLIEVQRSYGRKMNAHIFRYESSPFGNDRRVLINGPIPIWDDIFEDDGRMTHHLIDVGASYEDADGAQVHISYDGGSAEVSAYIRLRLWSDLPNHPDGFVTLTDGECRFEAGSKINF